MSYKANLYKEKMRSEAQRPLVIVALQNILRERTAWPNSERVDVPQKKATTRPV